MSADSTGAGYPVASSCRRANSGDPRLARIATPFKDGTIAVDLDPLSLLCRQAGCNTCTCALDGQYSCTDLPCPPSDCLYLGMKRLAGESFPSRDGCNACQCLRGGNVTCTEINCPCKPAAEWWRRYVGTSQQQCAVIDFDCSSYTTNFSNECGCGCEQEVRCAEYITDTIPEFCALCPFSIVMAPEPN